MVGNAGVLLSTVQYVKKTPARPSHVDAAMNDLIHRRSTKATTRSFRFVNSRTVNAS
jgi:diaminopimelate decarboxylase